MSITSLVSIINYLKSHGRDSPEYILLRLGVLCDNGWRHKDSGACQSRSSRSCSDTRTPRAWICRQGSCGLFHRKTPSEEIRGTLLWIPTLSRWESRDKHLRRRDVLTAKIRVLRVL